MASRHFLAGLLLAAHAHGSPVPGQQSDPVEAVPQLPDGQPNVLNGPFPQTTATPGSGSPGSGSQDSGSQGTGAYSQASDESSTCDTSASQISASVQPSTTGYRVQVYVSGYTSATYHGPYTGTPTTIGAADGPTTLAASIPALPPNPTATYYNTLGVPLHPFPAPYEPAGGLGTNGTLPRYMVESDFDFESIALGLYQEWIELDLFHDGLARFTDQEFLDAGLGPEARSLIEFMANQESGHATLLTDMLGPRAPAECYYNYPYTTVREWLDFCQRVTRWGESGVWGFINHLDSREVGQLLAQSIATEARQQQIFRQMAGLTPMDVWFENGWPQSWAWTMLAPYISYCPANETRLAWQNFPTLHILNNANINRVAPNNTAQDGSEQVGDRIGDPSVSNITCGNCINATGTDENCGPAIAHNRSEPLSFPGKKVLFEWDPPGQAVGPNNSYVTATNAGAPAWVAWSQQLNLTYSPLTLTGNNSGYTYQPLGYVYGDDGIINGTMAVLITDLDLFVTPFNISMLNPHIVALGLYMAG
ncbi:Uu.00g114580.m01.CDS01 [Anthostomella pinea]|uniref:Uu.00g114580.m01.CDS01 n=1 Tax=Anthostomella pinea TaxID=933095 RepID=A0AAI8YGN0_9PEZI|nr:Uu.00g114580.m01.CDS01 [Anthostomella pinea]